MTTTIRVPVRNKDVQFGRTLTSALVGMGLGDVSELSDELQVYTDELLGRTEASLDSPYLAMMEIAVAYYARAQEIDMQIHRAEREGLVKRGSPLYLFRTGELRAFIELSKKCAELGSRRLSQETLLYDARRSSSL